MGTPTTSRPARGRAPPRGSRGRRPHLVRKHTCDNARAHASGLRGSECCPGPCSTSFRRRDESRPVHEERGGNRRGVPRTIRRGNFMSQHYATPAAFKQAIENRLREAAACDGPGLSRSCSFRELGSLGAGCLGMGLGRGPRRHATLIGGGEMTLRPQRREKRAF